MTKAEGRAAYRAHQGSLPLRAACDPRTCDVELAQKLFLPPVPHDDVDRGLRRPLPEPYRAWRAGYLEAREEDSTCSDS